MITRRTFRRGSAILGSTALLALLGSSPALAGATTGDIDVVNTETVQVYMSADGSVGTKRVYEQLAMTGNGVADLANPIETNGLRNLDGFSGIKTVDGKQVIHEKVDGEKKTRSVSNYTGKLPLDVQVAYSVDGTSVEPGDVVGKSGKLQVDFTVENVTGKQQQLDIPDGKGGTTTRTEDVAIPMVGSLSTVAPPSFTNVRSKQANMAGDGEGGTKLSFTMTLFEPIGSTTASFGYTADITDGVVPRAEITALPVNPLQSSTFATAATSYQGGADTGTKLVDGAVQIDDNLLKLRDGSEELLAGLIKLRDGADQLDDGLSGEAAPGAEKLAAGAGALDAGLGKLQAGAGKLAGGTGDLAAGTGTALDGSKRLTSGLKQISGGLGQLSGQLPSATDGIDKLKAGVNQLIEGMGTEGDPQTLIGGLKALDDGLTQLKAGSTDLKGGLSELATGLGTAKGGVDQSQAGLDGAKSQLDAKLAANADIDDLIGGLNALENLIPACSGDATCKATAGGLKAGATAAKSDLQQLSGGLGLVSGGLGQVSVGLGRAITGLDTQLIPGAGRIEGGLSQSLAGVGKLRAGAGDVKGGLTQVKGGLVQLADGVTAAIAGVNRLNAGAGDAYNGSSRLSGGLGRIDDGANQLDDGANQLAAGAGDASDGSGLLAAGAAKLSSGLGDAADGSTKIANGLDEAAAAAPRLPAGAQELSDKGTQKLIAAGQSTTQTYSELVAIMKAGAERANASSMAYGAPDGAVGLTAYSYKIKGASGEGNRNLVRTLGGLVLLAGAAGGLALRRRLI